MYYFYLAYKFKLIKIIIFMKNLLLLVPTLLATPIYANSYVNDNLNAADTMFDYGMDGCTM